MTLKSVAAPLVALVSVDVEVTTQQALLTWLPVLAAYKQLVAWLQEGFRRAELQPYVETLMARIAKTLWDVPTTEERDLALLVLARMVRARARVVHTVFAAISRPPCSC